MRKEICGGTRKLTKQRRHRMIEEIEIGCWNCALEGVKSGKPCCPECGTEIAHYCGAYSHEKVVVEKSEAAKKCLSGTNKEVIR